MTRWWSALRFDVILQARQGFYAATAAIVILLGGLLLSIPAAARANSDLWVPFLIVVNMPITTFFFVCGLILLERDEGTLLALGVSPVSASQYLAMRMTTLVALALVETLVIVAIGFSIETPLLIGAGAVLLGVMLTGFGAGVSSRYTTVNEMILPGSVFVTFLLLPLLAHFGMVPRAPFFAHPVEPSLTLIRAAYAEHDERDLLFGAVGSIVWCGVAWWWGRSSLERSMRDTRASGGR